MAPHPGQRKLGGGADTNFAPSLNMTPENKDWYREMVEHSEDLRWTHYSDGKFVSINPRPALLLGYSIEEMMRLSLAELVAPAFRRRLDDYLREIKWASEARGQLVLLTRSGEERVWECHSVAEADGAEKPVIRTVARDVTERVRALQALQASNDLVERAGRNQERLLRGITLFRTMLDQANDAMQVIEPGTLRLLDVNEKTCEELGYSREELIGMTIYDIAPWFDDDARRGVLRQLEESGLAIFERVHRKKDGTLFPVEVRLSRVHLDREYGISVCRDITARKQSEERLREFERVVESLEEMIVVVNRKYQAVLANRAFLKYWGTTDEKVVGHALAEAIDPGVFVSVVKEKVDECFRGKSGTYELKYEHETKGKRELSITYSPIEGVSGVIRVACVLRDVTEQKRGERALRESEARERARAEELETVLDAVPVPVYISHSADCSQITGNRAAYEQMHLPAGSNLLNYRAPKQQSPFRLTQEGVEVPLALLPMQQAVATGKPVYRRHLRLAFEEGDAREIYVNAVPLLDEEGKPRGVVGASIDLTELKHAEKALEKSELRFRAAYDRSPVGICLIDSHSGRFLQANPKFCEIAGRSEEELLRTDVNAITHPDDIERGTKFQRQMAEDKLASYELDKRYVRPDGSVRWVRILVVPMWEKGATSRSQMALAEDITERKQATQSLQEAQAALAHVTRVVAMGELVASIAHEVNQPLTGVVMTSNFVLRELTSKVPNLEELREAVAEVVEDATRVSSVISRLRALFKKETSDRVKLDINAVIQEVTFLVRTEAGGNDVQIRLDLAADLPPVTGDRVQLQQVLINLAVNGIDAMRSVTERPRILDIRSTGHGDGVLIQVHDSGRGLDPDGIDHIFQPFFTTKPQGIGLGLSISRSIIESHGGRLWAEPGSQGALFQFTLAAGESGSV